jgi:hypothetical protein
MTYVWLLTILGCSSIYSSRQKAEEAARMTLDRLHGVDEEESIYRRSTHGIEIQRVMVDAGYGPDFWVERDGDGWSVFNAEDGQVAWCDTEEEADRYAYDRTNTPGDWCGPEGHVKYRQGSDGKLWCTCDYGPAIP